MGPEEEKSPLVEVIASAVVPATFHENHCVARGLPWSACAEHRFECISTVCPGSFLALTLAVIMPMSEGDTVNSG